MNEKTTFGEIKDKKRIYEFLDFHRRVVTATKMPYLRDFAALDFVKDKFDMNYKSAELFLNKLFDLGLLDYDQHGAFPGTILTPNGIEFLEFYEKEHLTSKKQGDENLENGSSEIKVIKEPLRTYIWGKTQDDPNAEIFHFKYDDNLIYRFMKFHIGVINRTGVPYLRELVAEDFLIDKEGLSFNEANECVNSLLEAGILNYDQFGAFPGTGVTKKGKQFFENLKIRLKIGE